VYPALAVVQALNPGTDILWVGSRHGMERALVTNANLNYQGISAAGLRGKNPLSMVKGLVALGWGYQQSRRLMKEYRPDVLFVTGGYVCVPTTLAAHKAGIPVVIYLPDIPPGQAIKFLSRYATKVAVTPPPAQKFFRARLTVVTGYPARPNLYRTDRQTACRALNLDPNQPVVLVFGGSQGARSINKAIARPAALTRLLPRTQLVHISGQRDADWTQAIKDALPTQQQQRYHLYPYLHQKMVAAFAAADLIVSRAGASILGEAPAVGAPAILVPYPYSGAHQWLNAQYMAEHGAALIVADDKLQNELLEKILLLLDNTEQRTAMGQAARRLARPDAAHAITRALEEARYERRVKY